MPISGKEVVRRLEKLGWEITAQRGSHVKLRKGKRGKIIPVIEYQAKLHKEGPGYWVDFPDLPGCFSEGDSREEALDNAREALSLWLEEARDPDWTVPVPKARKGRQYAWVAPYEDVAIPLMIRRARQRKGLSQRALAKKLGMSVQQLQKLEYPGKSNPTVKTLAAVSRALDEQLRIELVA